MWHRAIPSRATKHYTNAAYIFSRRTRSVSLYSLCRVRICRHLILAHSEPNLSANQLATATPEPPVLYTDSPCSGYNRCSSFHPVSWDAYAFRPPLPPLNASLLTSSVFMNMAQAENRAGAALVVARVAGSPNQVESNIAFDT